MSNYPALAPDLSKNPFRGETSMASPIPDRPMPKRRQLTQVACEFCRRKRIKCDGIRPKCHNCASRQAPCNYDTAHRQTRVAALKEEVERLRADNTALMEIFWRLQSTATEDAQLFLEFVKRSESLDFFSLTSYFHDQRLQRKPDEVNRLPLDAEPHPVALDMSNGQSSLESSKVDESTRSTTISPQSEPSLDGITVSEVQNAVEMFRHSAGALFHVFTKTGVAATVKEAFDSCLQPDKANFIKMIREETNASRRAQLIEISGMAAVGVLYLRLPQQQGDKPLPKSADVLYTITKHMLEASIEFCPLRAMKICALLAMYNIILKGVIALAYIELGLALGRSHGVRCAIPPPGVQETAFLDYKRVWNTLVLFSGWLDASLGHTYATAPQETQIRLTDVEEDPADVVQTEIVKVTVTKSQIIQAMAAGGSLDSFVVDKLRIQLRELHQGMPSKIGIGSVFEDRRPSPVRANIFYLHLFYLSAMQLLHRRVILHTEESKKSVSAKEAIREGVMAAKMAAKVLSLMRHEGAIVQICWLCIFSAYTSGIIILQAAVQKIITGHDRFAWIADLALVESCIQALQYCAEVDRVASAWKTSYKSISMRYATWRVVPEEDGSVDYLLKIPTSDDALHKAARDLLLLSQKPFSDKLELTSIEEAKTIQECTLVNWAEAAVGSPNEWITELRHGVGFHSDEAACSERCNAEIVKLMSTFRLGQFDSPDGQLPWETFTPQAF